jgi:hypothetical protein
MPTLEDLQLETFSVLLDSVLEASRTYFPGVTYPQGACWVGRIVLDSKRIAGGLFVVTEQRRFWQMHFIECTGVELHTSHASFYLRPLFNWKLRRNMRRYEG